MFSPSFVKEIGLKSQRDVDHERFISSPRQEVVHGKWNRRDGMFLLLRIISFSSEVTFRPESS